jgi:hypothetical protein
MTPVAINAAATVRAFYPVIPSEVEESLIFF